MVLSRDGPAPQLLCVRGVPRCAPYYRPPLGRSMPTDKSSDAARTEPCGPVQATRRRWRGSVSPTAEASRFTSMVAAPRARARTAHGIACASRDRARPIDTHWRTHTATLTLAHAQTRRAVIRAHGRTSAPPQWRGARPALAGTVGSAYYACSRRSRSHAARGTPVTCNTPVTCHTQHTCTPVTRNTPVHLSHATRNMLHTCDMQRATDDRRTPCRNAGGAFALCTPKTHRELTMRIVVRAPFGAARTAVTHSCDSLGLVRCHWLTGWLG